MLFTQHSGELRSSLPIKDDLVTISHDVFKNEISKHTLITSHNNVSSPRSERVTKELANETTSTTINKATNPAKVVTMKAQEVYRSTHVDLYPYRKYDPLAMEWINTVEEMEWIHRNSYNEDKKDYKKPFDHGTGEMWSTSVIKTRVIVKTDRNDIRKGSYICVEIETFDDNGRKRKRGGDFFTANMANVALQKSTAGRVVDHGNGTYSVFFYAAWSGEAQIDIALSFPREIIIHTKNTMRREELQGFAANYSDGKWNAETRCSLINEGVWSDRCEYINPNALGKTVFACVKLPYFSCDQLINVWSKGAGLNRLPLDEKQKVQYIYDGRYSPNTLKETPIKLKILEAEVSPPKLPPCGPDVPIPLSSGYWENSSVFVPLVCQSQQWRQQDIDNCIADKEFFSVGDSTLGPLVKWFLKSPELRESNIYFMTPRLAGPRVKIFETIFEADLIDKISKRNCQSKTHVVFLNFCFHFAGWSTRAYVERLVRVNLAILRLLQRCPNSKIMIKLAHSRENLYKEQRNNLNWIYYDMNRIARRVFGGTGVLFLDLWDMINSSFQENTIHMHGAVAQQEFYLAISYICPEYVKLQ
uniref:NXPE family member 4-like n=1 Tax=Saccoglossus kowalevskii TaxID=10224 RepID=A0ABM0M018_SACKO|nr:PREDICTED: NXPE family member 4-like [Saccoglossus kowalevskii]